MKKEYIVKNSGIRLDKVLAELDKDLSRMAIQKLIEENKVLVNKKIEKPSYKVKENDIIELEVEKPKESKLKPEEIDLNVIYEDNDIIIINKAKGMVVHPGNGNPEGTFCQYGNTSFVGTRKSFRRKNICRTGFKQSTDSCRG